MPVQACVCRFSLTPPLVAAALACVPVVGFFVTGLSNVYAYAGCIFLFGAGLVATNTCLNIFISDTM